MPLHTVDDVQRDPSGVTTLAIEHLTRGAAAWWLHVDLDVLSGAEFPACAAATDPAMPGGLTWAELTAICATALRAEGCRGWSVGVYNTDLDPTGEAAHRIVRFLAEALGGPNP